MNAGKPVVLSADQDQDRKRKKRGAIVKFSLAGVALLGIGAAATSAAWSDNAWFSGTAAAATVNLKGAVSNTTTDVASTDSSWQIADTSATAVVVDPTEFANLLPGDTKTVYVHLLNAGSTKLSIAAPTVTLTNSTDFGLIATATATQASVTLGSAPATIDSGAQVAIPLTVTASGSWNQAAAGKTTTVTISFAGTATH